MGVNALSASLLVMRGRLYLAEGRPSDAARVIAEGLALGEPDAQTFSDAQSALAERELRSGRSVEARDRLAPLVTQAGMDEPDLVGLLPLLAWANLEMGEIERAASVVAQAIQLLRAMGMRVMLVNALRIQAMVAQRHGDLDTAETTLAEAVTLADAIGYPYAKAQALFVWALLAPADEASQERLREAHTIFTRLGASGDATLSGRALKTR
jgi:tetratricopeptide (TPR) repeat protein